MWVRKYSFMCPDIFHEFGVLLIPRAQEPVYLVHLLLFFFNELSNCTTKP